MSRKVLNRVHNKLCKRWLNKELPSMKEELKEYFNGSSTTGTQPITLCFAVKQILKYKPKMILESGTGASTIVLSLAVKKLKAADPTYECKIVSMESVQDWYEIAKANLPENHSDIVEIVYGPRQQYDVAMFRGYIHSNIPDYDYDFVFLDGPYFDDDKGTSFCADVLYVYQSLGKKKLRGVFDGRASSAFVIQTLFGKKSVTYFIPSLAGKFCIPEGKSFETFHTTDFRSGLSGRLYLKNR